MKNSGTVVRLDATPEVIFDRVNRNDKRPLVKGKTLEDIKMMISDREEAYKNAADITVDASTLNVDEVTSEIVKQLALAGRLN